MPSPKLHSAVLRGNIDHLKTLLKEGANVNVPNSAGNTALHWAVKLDEKKIIQLLMNHGADLTIKNHANQTPCDVASEDTLNDILNRTN